MKVPQEIHEKLQHFLTSYSVKNGGDEVFRFEGRLQVPNNEEFRSQILHEPYYSKYTNHPNAIKTYREIKWMYCWSGVKKGIAEFVSGFNMSTSEV